MLADLVHRLRALFARNAVEREIDAELRFHLARQIESYEREGLDRGEASRRARLEFGGFDQMKEDYRDALGTRLLHESSQDVSYGLRMIRRRPLSSIAAAAT